MLSLLKWPLAVTQFLSRTRFRKEITIVIIVKLIALFILWEFFITHPTVDRLTKPALVKHFVSH